MDLQKNTMNLIKSFFITAESSDITFTDGGTASEFESYDAGEYVFTERVYCFPAAVEGDHSGQADRGGGGGGDLQRVLDGSKNVGYVSMQRALFSDESTDALGNLDLI